MQLKQQIENWREKLRTGTLNDADLVQGLDQFDKSDSPTQRILYLQCRSSAIDGSVIG